MGTCQHLTVSVTGKRILYSKLIRWIMCCRTKKGMAAVFVAPFIIFSCHNMDSFMFEDSERVTDFPVDMSVQDPDTVKTDAIGIQGIKVLDDCILLSAVDSSGCILAYDKKNFNRSRHAFLNVGRGSGEVLFRPYMSWITFRTDSDGILRAGLYDFKGHYVEYDVYGSLSGGKPSWKEFSDSLPDVSGTRYTGLGEEYLICRKSKDDGSGYERYLVDRTGRKTVNAAMAYLNSFRSSENNLLSTMFLTNPEKGIVAELGGRLSVVHIYSISDAFGKTLYMGNRPEDIKEMETLSPEEMPKAYYDGKAYDGFFVGLYLGTTVKELDEGRFGNPQLHFFSWEGEPLARVTLPESVLSFDIDVKESQLYVVRYDDEAILKYALDLSGIIKS